MNKIVPFALVSALALAGCNASSTSPNPTNNAFIEFEGFWQLTSLAEDGVTVDPGTTYVSLNANGTTSFYFFDSSLQCNEQLDFTFKVDSVGNYYVDADFDKDGVYDDKLITNLERTGDTATMTYNRPVTIAPDGDTVLTSEAVIETYTLETTLTVSNMTPICTPFTEFQGFWEFQGGTMDGSPYGGIDVKYSLINADGSMEKYDYQGDGVEGATGQNCYNRELDQLYTDSDGIYALKDFDGDGTDDDKLRVNIEKIDNTINIAYDYPTVVAPDGDTVTSSIPIVDNWILETTLTTNDMEPICAQ